MKIALVGGIYGMPEEYRTVHKVTPETTLEFGLREAGHTVEIFGHSAIPSYAKYDVVHVHHMGRGMLRAALDRSETPLVFTRHAFPQQRRARKQPVWPPRSHGMVLPFITRRIDGFVALSAIEQRYADKHYNLNGALSKLIPNGIHTEFYSRARVERKADEPWRLLYVGQLIPSKRVDVLLRALRQLTQPFELRLAYHNPMLERDLMQLAAELGIGDRVKFLGGQKLHELITLYNNSDLLTFPSASESLPGVVAEAMLCGLPVVATKAGGIPEMLGDFGVQVLPNDDVAMLAGIETAIHGYNALYAQSEAMRDAALKRYSVESSVRQHVELYEAVLNRPGPRRRNQAALLPRTLAIQLVAKSFVLR